MHNLNSYRIQCEKDKLDLTDTTLALKDARSQAISQDHSVTVVVGIIGVLVGVLLGSQMQK